MSVHAHAWLVRVVKEKICSTICNTVLQIVEQIFSFTTLTSWADLLLQYVSIKAIGKFANELQLNDFDLFLYPSVALLKLRFTLFPLILELFPPNLEALRKVVVSLREHGDPTKILRIFWRNSYISESFNLIFLVEILCEIFQCYHDYYHHWFWY